MRFITNNYKGILFSVILAIFASILGIFLPIIGGAVFGIVLGILIGIFFKNPKGTEEGVKFSSKVILQWAIVFLGAGLSFQQVYKVGISSFFVMVFILSAAFITAYL